MRDDDTTATNHDEATTTRRHRAASRPAGAPAPVEASTSTPVTTTAAGSGGNVITSPTEASDLPRPPMGRRRSTRTSTAPAETSTASRPGDEGPRTDSGPASSQTEAGTASQSGSGSASRTRKGTTSRRRAAKAEAPEAATTTASAPEPATDEQGEPPGKQAPAEEQAPAQDRSAGNGEADGSHDEAPTRTRRSRRRPAADADQRGTSSRRRANRRSGASTDTADSSAPAETAAADEAGATTADAPIQAALQRAEQEARQRRSESTTAGHDDQSASQFLDDLAAEIGGGAGKDESGRKSASKSGRKSSTRSKARSGRSEDAPEQGAEEQEGSGQSDESGDQGSERSQSSRPRRRASRRTGETAEQSQGRDDEAGASSDDDPTDDGKGGADHAGEESADPEKSKRSGKADRTDKSDGADDETGEGDDSRSSHDDGEDDSSGAGTRRRRRRGGRRRRRGESGEDESGEEHGDEEDGEEESSGAGTRRRRRRRRRRGEDTAGSSDDPSDVVVKVREPRARHAVSDEVTGIDGSTRMEAKKQRRREGRAAGRRRSAVLTEAEFLARRESVRRTMLIRQAEEYSQLAVLEDDVLVEHYVDRASAASSIGNIYLGKVQNVLPSMEAAFIDIGRGRNAVLYAGEVDWARFGKEGEGKRIENVLKSGDQVLVQVSKDPVGAKGARLTSHISIPGRYVVYSPDGQLSGISRKLADAERKRLKKIIEEAVPSDASVIVRTAAEGASEADLVRDVNRLKAQWEVIERKAASGHAPAMLYSEPDLTVRIIRDLFTEDFSELVVAGNGGPDDAYDTIKAYVDHVSPDLADRLKRWDTEADGDLFAKYRIDEQIAKALERKVFLPSGGSLVIDRTEAMTVIDVNTGKFTGSAGNLEATVTANNLEAAEEIVRQLRLRDIGGIIVVDFIDMVLPANRELLVRRLVECLGRDRTRHQVAEVTSLGLVQMTRKKIGTGLAEAFTEECSECGGRGYHRHTEPVDSQAPADGGERSARRSRSGKGRSSGSGSRSGAKSGGRSGSKPEKSKDHADQ